MGSTTLLHPPAGIPMLPARLIAEMQRRSRDSAPEPIEVVLVAEKIQMTRGVTVPWGRVVGVICEEAERLDQSDIPIVTGVPDVMRSIADDVVVLIDGDRGTVLIEPDSLSVAAFQAERERISPRRRFFLDFEHQPARTAGGRTIHVAASVSNLDDCALALSAGADSLFVPESARLFTPGQSEDEQFNLMLEYGRAAAGKALIFAADLQRVSPAALLKAGMRAEIGLALPLAAGPESFQGGRAALEQARVELTAAETDFGDARVIGRLGSDEELRDELAAFLIGRVVLTGVGLDGAPLDAEWIADISRLAAPLLIPVLVECESAETHAAQILGAGASGLIVPPDSAAAVKTAIRLLD